MFSPEPRRHPVLPGPPRLRPGRRRRLLALAGLVAGCLILLREPLALALGLVPVVGGGRVRQLRVVQPVDRAGAPVPEAEPAPAPRDAGAGQAAHSLRVVTYNIRYGRGLDGVVDLERLARTVSDLAPDIVVLQEVDRNNPRSGLVDQAQWLGRRLGMAVAYGPNLNLGWTQYGNAILSRFPILEAENAALPGRWEPRGLLRATVELPGGDRLAVYTTHLGLQRQERAHQVAALLALLPAGSPLVLAGDFNSRPDEPWLQAVADRLVDAHAVAGDGPGYTFPSGAPSARIDHVFVSEPFSVTAAGPVVSDASDHLPVVADLVLPRGTAGQE